MMTLEEQRQSEAKVAAFQAMPTIITEPGDYMTRDGRRVTIHTVARTGATGAIWKEFRGQKRPRGYFGWFGNGRRELLSERRSDIVERWRGLNETVAAMAPMRFS